MLELRISDNKVAVTKIATPKDIRPEGRAWVEEHGCQITEYPEALLVLFPPGTMKAEVLPRFIQERYLISLPDGAQIMEQMLTGMQDGLSIFFLKKDET